MCTEQLASTNYWLILTGIVLFKFMSGIHHDLWVINFDTDMVKYKDVSLNHFATVT